MRVYKVTTLSSFESNKILRIFYSPILQDCDKKYIVLAATFLSYKIPLVRLFTPT